MIYDRAIYIVLALLSGVLLYTSATYALDSRMGVLLPGQMQMQEAVRAAALGQDEPLDEPEIEVQAAPPLPATLEQPSELEKKVAESLESITLEEKIQQQVVQAELAQFGYDIFSSVPTTFAPVEGIPVPPDYIIGPGDTFLLQIYGLTDVQYRLVVTREGKLLIPEMGEMQLSGLTFEEAKFSIKEQISKLRVGVKAVVTLAELHTIQVVMVGEVQQPGAYTVSGLSSLLNTLITTGGIKRSGSLRDIQVRRQNKVIARMDLYQMLLQGVDESNIYLRQGDVVFVPPIGNTMGIAGEVQRPAIYEMKNERTVGEVLALAGGLLPTAAAKKSHIERITADGVRTLIAVDLDRGGSGVLVQNGDLLRVFPVLNKMENVVLLSGHVLVPGGFQWQPGMRVSNLITTTKMLRQSAEYQVALIQREIESSKRLQPLYFNLGRVLSAPGSADDLLLQPRDQLIIFDTSSPRGKQVSDVVRRLQAQATATNPPAIFELKGAVRHSGLFPLQQGMRLLQAIDVGGEIPPGTDMQYMLLVRTDPVSRDIEFIALSLEEALRNPLGDHNPYLLVEDRVYLFDTEIDRSAAINKDLQRLQQQSRYGELSPIVQVSGKVLKPGRYPMLPGMRLRDLLVAAGGMKEDAFGLAATLSRQGLIDGEFAAVDHLDVALFGPSQRSGYDAAMILRPYDHLIIREKPEWVHKIRMVKLEGEILYPGEYQINKRDTLCSLVQRAGGFTEDAYLFGAVFLRESVRQREQEALDRLFDDLDDLLVDVHISPGFQKDQKLPVNKGADDISRVIRRMKRNKAAGRMVIDVEAAVNRCDEESDIVLEDGDRLYVPQRKNEVTVVGQVYMPGSHRYRSDRGAFDYINLSGGTKELAMADHAFVVQANGEVMTVRDSNRGNSWFFSSNNISVTPGSTVYVPLSVDRINSLEFSQSWIDLLYKLSISAASLDYLFSQ